MNQILFPDLEAKAQTGQPIPGHNDADSGFPSGYTRALALGVSGGKDSSAMSLAVTTLSRWGVPQNWC